MTAPSEVRACYQALRPATVAVTAVFLLALCACGQSQNGGAGSESQSSAAQTNSSQTSSSPAATQPDASPTRDGDTSPAQLQMDAASGTGDESQAVDVGSVTIEADADANNGAPIAVDLVFVYDDALITQLKSKSASAWFKTKSALEASESDKLKVISWSVVPGEQVPETPVDVPSGAVAAYVFSNYSSPGDHRLRIAGSGTLSITLAASEASYQVDQ